MSSACLSAYRRALANPSFLSHFLPLPHLQKQNNIIQGWTIPNHQLIDSAGAVLQQMFVGCCAATDDCFVAGAVLQQMHKESASSARASNAGKISYKEFILAIIKIFITRGDIPTASSGLA